jgi:hypothetical protein
MDYFSRAQIHLSRIATMKLKHPLSTPRRFY